MGVFKLKQIRSFYGDPRNELFRFPMQTIDAPNYNRSNSLHHKTTNKNSSSPLQKITNSISSKIGMSFLSPRTPPISDQQNHALLQNLDNLILPPTFFNDDKSKKQNQTEKISKFKTHRSQSLDALPVTQQMLKTSKRLIHEPHIEHGICAALQYIVSFVLHASRYLNVCFLYNMGIYRKDKRNKFVMHTFIERKGKCYRLYWIKCKLNAKKQSGNILEFEHALHLLEENINHFCIECGVKSNKLQYFQFIANLNALMAHLRKKQNAQTTQCNVEEMMNKRMQPKIEPVRIIHNYGHSASNSVSYSFSESVTAITNSESDVVISPHGDSEHSDWDFVEYT